MTIKTNDMTKSEFLNILCSDSKWVFAIRAQTVAIRAIIDSISISFKTIGIIKHIEREINMVSMISLKCLFMLFLYEIIY